MTDAAPLLRVDRLSRRFGGVAAVDEVSFEVRQGEICGLIGPNGAGKTTLLNLLSGLTLPTSGDIYLSGRRVTSARPEAIAACGVRRTYQNLRTFPQMTALENILAGQHLSHTSNFWGHLLGLPGARRPRESQKDEAIAVLERVGLGARWRMPAGVLPYGEQRRLEVARALAGHPRLLLLDEPVAGINPAEEERLRELLPSIAAEGTAIIVVEHHMPFVMAVCPRIIVVDFGRVIAEGSPNAVRAHPAVLEAYLGAG